MALGVGRKELVMVGVLLTGTLLAVLNLTMLSPALPAIMGDLGVRATQEILERFRGIVE